MHHKVLTVFVAASALLIVGVKMCDDDGGQVLYETYRYMAAFCGLYSVCGAVYTFHFR